MNAVGVITNEHRLFSAPIGRTRKIRPLGDVSDFVVERLPSLLDCSDPTHLNGAIRCLDASIPAERFRTLRSMPDAAARIACLDLALLKHALGHQGIGLPARLAMMLHALAERFGRLPTMLYEDNILFNPLTEDPRLFCTAENAGVECAFLMSHAQIETCLDQTLGLLMPLARCSVAAPCRADMADIHQRVDRLLADIMSRFTQLHRMPPESFACFRDFYGAPAASPFPGVSGRYSETMNSLRILIEGADIMHVIPNYFDELIGNSAYFPSTGRERLNRLIRQAVMPDQDDGGSLSTLAGNLPESGLQSIVARVRQCLDVIARVHSRLAKKYVSGAPTIGPRSSE